MCLSTAYEMKNGNKTLVLKQVSRLLAENGAVTITDLMGERVVVSGTVKSIDLLSNVILIEAAQSPK